MKYLLIAISVIFASSSLAEDRPVATVVEIKGHAFAFKGNKSQPLRYGDRITEFAEVMVEDGSRISIRNTRDHVFHLNGGGFVKLFKDSIELKNGQVMVVSEKNNFKGTVTTGNAMAQYGEGHLIVSFDQTDGKSQLLVMEGVVEFSNALEPDLKTRVQPFQFSFVTPDYENNLPRTPTKIGERSLRQIKQEFGFIQSKYLDSLMNEPTKKETKQPARSIASVIEEYAGKKPVKRKGKVIRISSIKGRVPASFSAVNYYKQSKQQARISRQPQKTGESARIRYFGQKWKAPQQSFKTNIVQSQLPSKTKQVDRQPASVKKSQLIEDLKKNSLAKRKPASLPGKSQLLEELKSPFEKSYKVESQKTKRHSDTLNNLVDELKSYDKDFDKEY